MLTQIAIGTAMIVAATVVAAGFVRAGNAILIAVGGWIVRPPHNPKFALVLVFSVLWFQATVTVVVWMWSLLLFSLGALPDLETSVYFSIVSFTTLGLGDVVMSRDWRILSGFASGSGLLLFGLYIAILADVILRVRSEQLRGSPDKE